MNDIQVRPHAGPPMRSASPEAGPGQELYVPSAWAPGPAPARDVALDLLRGLAMAILVVNHTALESPLRDATRAVLSAAEVLVMVSGVVAGMVFGRRWRAQGPRVTTLALLRRARTLYVASVAVVALVGLATLVPGLHTDALAVSPRVVPPVDSYAYDGLLAALAAIVTLEAGPWQFNILGFFVAAIALAPGVLWALARGWWPLVVALSWAVYLLGRGVDADVLPSQSERAFPLLVWQLPFVNGVVAGWHRRRLAAWLRRRRRVLAAAVVVAACAIAAARVAGPSVWGPERWAAFEAAHFHKGSLDLLRVAAMATLTAALYVVLRGSRTIARLAGPVLLPLGRSSFYVFIVHVFVCLAVASALAPAGGSAGPAGNVAIQAGCVALLCLMARRRVLFRWIPR